MKIIIAGGRDFLNKNLLYNKCDEIIKDLISNGEIEIEIVTGRANGADTLGEEYAVDRGYKSTVMEAKWRTNGVYNPSAGYRRNERMGRYSGMLIAFWNKESKGTKHMIDYMHNEEKRVEIILVNY